MTLFIAEIHLDGIYRTINKEDDSLVFKYVSENKQRVLKKLKKELEKYLYKGYYIYKRYQIYRKITNQYFIIYVLKKSKHS